MDGYHAGELQDLRIKPPSFQGKKGENVIFFYSKLKKYIDSQNIEGDDCIEATGLCLEGDPFEHFDQLRRKDNQINYDAIKESLIKRFDDDKIAIVIR